MSDGVSASSQRNPGVPPSAVKSRSTTRVGVPSLSAESSSSTAIRRPSREAAASKPVAQVDASSPNHGSALSSGPSA